MALIAQKILAITATSASCERSFSTMGKVYTNKRQRMKAETASSVERKQKLVIVLY